MSLELGPLGVSVLVLAVVLLAAACYRLGDLEGRAAERHEEFERTLAEIVHLASDAEIAQAVARLTAEVRRRLLERGVDPDAPGPPDAPDGQGRDTWKSNR